MPDEKKDLDNRTCTQTLVDCLEEFGKSEAKRVLVIYINEADEICWSTNGRYSFVQVLGMLECVRARVGAKFLEGFDK